MVKRSGKVAVLEQAANLLPNQDTVFTEHCGIAHTRWATHGPANEVWCLILSNCSISDCCAMQVNAHPHISDSENSFVVIHNGIITNNKEIKQFLQGHVCCASMHSKFNKDP